VVTAEAVLETSAPTPIVSGKRGIIMTSADEIADEIRRYLAVIIEEDADQLAQAQGRIYHGVNL